VLSSLPLWRVCAYDVGALPDDMVAAAEATHPYLRRAGASAANPAYVEPAELLRLPDPDLAPLPEREPDLELHDVHVHDLRGLARRVQEILDAARLESERADDLLLVLNEVATNGLRHGEPPVTVRLWAGSERIDCTVTDRGTGIDDPLAGYLPGGGEALPEGRFGLWLARRLCDDLVTTRSPEGFTVRLVLNR
jgi:anti-sigma regulatory factor (Ser/Thr protein kinase)